MTNEQQRSKTSADHSSPATNKVQRQQQQSEEDCSPPPSPAQEPPRRLTPTAAELRELRAPMTGVSLGDLTTNAFCHSRFPRREPLLVGNSGLYHPFEAGRLPREEGLTANELRDTIQQVLDMVSDDDDLW